MAEYQYMLWDVFTDTPLAGNQLAVVLSAEGMEPELMQRVANEFSLPETTFVLPPTVDKADFRVRIFTPDRELPMAGHPTVGTAFALWHTGRLAPGSPRTVFELGIGPTPVLLEWHPDRLANAWMSQPPPELGARAESCSRVAGALGVREDELAPDLPVQVLSSGVPFLFVPLRSRAAVDAAVLDRVELATVCDELAVPELPVYVFTLEAAGDDATTYSRMFAPVFGIAEDPATGGASGPLAAYLKRYRCDVLKGAESVVNMQGVKMNRPSRIRMAVDTDAGDDAPVLVGGRAVMVGEGWLCL